MWIIKRLIFPCLEATGRRLKENKPSQRITCWSTIVKNAMTRRGWGKHIPNSLSPANAMDKEPSGHAVTDAFVSTSAPQNPGWCDCRSAATENNLTLSSQFYPAFIHLHPHESEGKNRAYVLQWGRAERATFPWQQRQPQWERPARSCEAMCSVGTDFSISQR